MKGHRRDQSESNVPLRQSELQAACDNQEIRIQTKSLADHNPGNGTLAVSTTRVHEGLETGEVEEQRPARRAPKVSLTCRSAPLQRLRTELIKTAIAFYCLMLAAFLNFFLLTVIHDIVPMSTTKRLPDLVFFVVDQQRWAWAVGDVLSTVNAVVGFVVVLLHKERIVVLRRVFLIGAIMYGLRAVVLSVTFLPPAFDYHEEICMPQSNRTGMYASEIAARFVTYVVTLGLTSGQDKILCGDLMFSGHTVVLTIMYFTQLQYTPRRLVILRYIATPITFLGIAALVVSGGHYTMDVLIAYWLTSHVFWSYHQMFELPHAERAQAPLSRLWWFWMCYWFEQDVATGKMVNEWNWPLPGPRFMRQLLAEMNARLQ